MTHMKNIKLTDWSSERQQCFHRTICLQRFNILRKLHHICALNIFAMYNFELIWSCLAIPNHARRSKVDLSLTYRKSSSLLYWFLRYQNFRNHSQSGWLRAFWGITRDLEFARYGNLDRKSGISLFRMF